MEIIRTMETMFGIGYDIHKLEADRPLVLGGVNIPFEKGLDGDSDADVVCHSIIDALLGATGMGDIGSFFGVGTPEVMGARSLDMLSDLKKHLDENNIGIVNIDTTIIAQAPKLGDFRSEMISNISKTLNTKHVSVKFTTPKHIGSLGRSEAIACLAVLALKITFRK
ncbi:MAG: 2-C-methyl-D-erythritol 2,4-cyclodiphosphate synthase [Caldisericia bacterium]